MKIASILVAIDFGDASLEALRLAFALAEPLRAKVTLLHVAPSERADERATALEGLRALAQLHRGSPSLGSLHVVSGVPAYAVVACAQELQASLLVIGLNGGLGMKSELLGGNAEGILRNAPCPVVLARPTELSLLARAEEERNQLS
jgi:nucleotide-binding universal stress UspA family protein